MLVDVEGDREVGDPDVLIDTLTLTLGSAVTDFGQDNTEPEP
jgi:hypothetical protein